MAGGSVTFVIADGETLGLAYEDAQAPIELTPEQSELVRTALATLHA